MYHESQMNSYLWGEGGSCGWDGATNGMWVPWYLEKNYFLAYVMVTKVFILYNFIKLCICFFIILLYLF